VGFIILVDILISKNCAVVDEVSLRIIILFNVFIQVYLVDYGLAYRYMADGAQKPYKEDPKRTHDGTIEFTSRDAHRGACKRIFTALMNI